MKHKSKFILAALISLLGFTASLVDLSEVDVQLPAFFDEWTSQEQISAEEIENLPVKLVPGKDTSHQTKNNEAFYSGYAEGIRFTEKERLSV